MIVFSESNSHPMQPPADICVVGGAGHIGLPLSIVMETV
jgi:hypothetical protein